MGESSWSTGKGWSEDQLLDFGQAFNQLWLWGSHLTSVSCRKQICFMKLVWRTNLPYVHWESLVQFMKSFAHRYKAGMSYRNLTSTLLCISSIFGEFALKYGRGLSLYMSYGISYLVFKFQSQIWRSRPLTLRAGIEWGKGKEPGARVTQGCGIH